MDKTSTIKKYDKKVWQYEYCSTGKGLNSGQIIGLTKLQLRLKRLMPKMKKHCLKTKWGQNTELVLKMYLVLFWHLFCFVSAAQLFSIQKELATYSRNIK